LKVRSRFNLAAIILSEPILHAIRREVKRLDPDVRISVEEITEALKHEVLKRDVFEGEKAAEAQKLIAKAASKALRQRKAKGEADNSGVVAVDDDGPVTDSTPPA
jgi:hypothetical protein